MILDLHRQGLSVTAIAGGPGVIRRPSASTSSAASIRQAFTRFTPQECCNYLAAAGYENDLAVAT